MHLTIRALLVFCLAAVSTCAGIAAVAAEPPVLPRLYTFKDLAACLDAFREREFFEHIYRFAEIERTPELMFMTGHLYHHGIGVERDCGKAAVWYRRAGEAGYRFPYLGREADAGLKRVREDPVCAGRVASRPAVEELAAAGDAGTMRRVATQYYYGICAPMDHGRSTVWEERAAGRALPPDPPGEATAAPTPAAGLQPLREYAAGIYREGLRHYRGDGTPVDYFQAAVRFSEAADFGIEEAECYFLLADIQENGRCGDANPYGAGKGYRLAAELGHAGAMFRLAALHEEGRGVRRSRREAATWYARAAAAGVAGADAAQARAEQETRTGHREEWEMSEEFRRISLDAAFRAFYNHSPYMLPDEMATATAWLERAAVAGHGYAMYVFALLAKNGSPVHGVPPDQERSADYLRRAAQAGIQEARDDLQSGKR